MYSLRIGLALVLYNNMYAPASSPRARHIVPAEEFSVTPRRDFGYENSGNPFRSFLNQHSRKKRHALYYGQAGGTRN
jgi:hypothetical protein